MTGRAKLSRVSVIIPTYNRSELLRQTVESVLAQTYSNIETMVVDDGSTDDTAAVMAEYAGRIKYIRQENQGDWGVTASNVGLRASSGEYVGFLDHDDLFMPTKIERQVQVLDSRRDIDLVHCGYYLMDKEGNYTEKIAFLPAGTLKELVCGNLIWSGGPLIRRECLDEIGGFGKVWAGDWDMWLRMALAGYQFACIQEPLGAYRMLPGSMMSNLNKLEEACFAILDKVFAEPQLPAEVAAVKAQAYGGLRFWIGCSYYAAGRWDDAKRNMTAALVLRPQLLEQPEGFLQALSDQALGPEARISTPAKFVADVFDHLPPEVEHLRQRRSQALGHLSVGLALRHYGAGKIDEAKRQLAEAIALNPALLEDAKAFTDAVRHRALRLPINEPIAHVDAVFQNLPAEAQRLGRERSRVLGDVAIECAFQDYFAGRHRLVPRQILLGLCYRPLWLRNRGVISIFLRSLLKMMTDKPDVRRNDNGLVRL
jgi:cellulose synthase/poly-beta-1,6-N-acetylglucosamine synthase-like glycosyltransferase